MSHHHDEAYRWAEQRKIETHPKTGSAQLVEVRETVQEIVVPVYVADAEAAAVSGRFRIDDLLGYGVPAGVGRGRAQAGGRRCSA